MPAVILCKTCGGDPLDCGCELTKKPLDAAIMLDAAQAITRAHALGVRYSKYPVWGDLGCACGHLEIEHYRLACLWETCDCQHFRWER
jgi:hypothetical protein